LDHDKILARARNNAYSLLRQRPRSEYEIRNRLKLKRYNESVVEKVISALTRSGDIDDRKFARLWMESRMYRSAVGDVVLRHELMEKGVSESIIEATLSEKAERYDEYEVAFSMAREAFERLKKLDRQKAMKRVYDFLLRRGFKYDTIRRIVDNLARPG
jgi:regulatory protein